VNIVSAGPAIVAGILVFFAPGLAFLSLLPKERERPPLDERLYLAVGVSVAVSSWVALALAEAGRFSLVRGALVVALACASALLVGRRHVVWPLSPPRNLIALVPAVALLSVTLLLDARPGEYLVGGRDPGTYVAAMALIGRTGGIAYVDPVVKSIPPEDVGLFFRNPKGPDFSWGRFMGFPLEQPGTARVVPEFFHLFPAFGAYLFQAMGVRGALATPIVFGVLGTLGSFFAFRRIFGSATAFLGTGLLSLNVVQVWFARYPVSEPMSQFLIMTGLLALGHWEEDGRPAWGLLGGFALGLTLLVRIDSILVVGPLVLYLLVRHARRELGGRSAAALLAPFLLLLIHAVFHASFWSRKYLINIATRHYWQHSPAEWIGGLAAAALVVAGTARLGPQLIRALESHGSLVRRTAIAVVVGLALYAYFVRPSLSAWAGGDGNRRAAALAHPGVLMSLGFRQLAAHDAQAFLRLGWFVTPLVLALGIGGLVLAIHEWRRRYLFPVLLALTFSAFYFYKILVFADYFFALRRFVPVTLPALFAFAGFMLVRMAARGRLGRIVAVGMTLFLVGTYLRDTIPVARHVDWRGSVRFVDNLSRRFGPDDVVIFEKVQSVHLLAIPLWAVHGVNVLELARFDPDPERLRHLIQAWRGVYKNIYFVHTYRTNLCGLFLQRVEDQLLSTVEWERTYDRRPVKPEPRALRFTISRVVPPEELHVPALPTVDIGGSDDFQVSGFFDKEGGGDQTYRWTGSCGSVYLPGARPGATLAITASAGERPEKAKPPLVAVSLSGAPLGSFLAGPKLGTYSLLLPDPLPAGPPVLRLDVPAWRPINFLPGSSDVRDLGVMVDRIQVEP
jgi:Dolichyl-phosphate-mannose-protein mannosyltransferase